MDLLSTIVHDLTVTESLEFQEWLKKHYKNDKSLKKRIHLFKLIELNPTITDRELSASIFNCLPDNNIQHLKKTTYDSILHFLYISNLRKSDSENKASEAERNCYIHLDIVRNLMNRGLTENAKQAIFKIQKIASKYNLFMVKIVADMLYRECISNEIGSIEYEKTAHTLKDDIKNIESHINAYELRDRAIFPTNFLRTHRDEYLELLEDTIEILLQMKLKSHSPVIQLRYIEVMAKYMEVTNQFHEAYELLKEGLEIAIKNPALKKIYWLRYPFTMSGDIAVKLKKYGEASKYYKFLLENLNPMTMEFLQLLHKQFRVALSLQNYSLMEEILSRITTRNFLKRKNINLFITWELNKAALYFVSGNYKQYLKSIEIVRKNCTTRKSLPETLLYLELLDSLEKFDVEKAEIRIKLLIQKLNESDFSYRLKEILSICKELLFKNHGQFNNLNDPMLLSLDLLLKQEKHFNWDCFSNEIIPFHKFYKEKYYSITKKELILEIQSKKKS